MSTALTPADLVRDAEDALTAARLAETLLAKYPDLPVVRMHAGGADGEGNAAPLLELQVDQDAGAVATWAAEVGVDVLKEPFLRSTQHRATTVVDGVTVMVTAYVDRDDEDDREPCGEGHCHCYGVGPEHADCACGCDCPRDEDGQLYED